MARSIVAFLGAAALLGAATPAAAQPVEAFTATRHVEGLWMNPHGTVAVKTGACGDKLCGWIVWASPAAEQDARDSGIDKLIGTELLQDYSPSGGGRWSGKVYVPDMGGHFSSTITPVGEKALEIKGCLIGGFFCKSQMWTRTERTPT